MPERVLIAGGGFGGLVAALAFARAGHEVTVIERDPPPAAATPEAAFAADRRGAPQAHQTHGFLARIVLLLRDRFPDVLETLLAEGCTTMSGTANLGPPRPGDEDLRVLIVRRTTFEWVLRRAVLAEPSVVLRPSTGVRALVASEPAGGPPVITGVVTDGGGTLHADLVVAATGRRGDVPAWLAAHGVEVREKIHESGLMYLTQWYRLPAGFDVELDPRLGGDLGFVKYLAVPGDGGTLSVTLAVRADDRLLREQLSETGAFEAACRALPGPDRFFAGGARPAPIGGVRPMAGLLNRIRQFTDPDGAPVVLGFHAIGDAHTCTNPLYGRGCSLAAVQAVLLADAAAAHPGDPLGRAAAYEAASARDVEPWWRLAVQMDRAGADRQGPSDGPADGTADRTGGLAPLLAAAATDPVIGRGMVRLWNLLATPAELMADAEFASRAAAVMADPAAHPLPPREGPTRDELVAVTA